MQAKNPTHPGEMVLVLRFEPFDLRITTDLAVRLDEAFDRAAEVRLRLQSTHDLDFARKTSHAIERIDQTAYCSFAPPNARSMSASSSAKLPHKFSKWAA